MNISSEQLAAATFQQKFTWLTGLTWDVEKLIAESEDKETLYKKLLWLIPQGCMDESEGPIGDLYASVYEELSNLTNDDIDGSYDGSYDSDIDDVDIDLASSIEVLEQN